MLPINRILVPTDFSNESGVAEVAAAELAKVFGCELTLLHVYEPVVLPLPEGYILYTPDQLTQLLGDNERLLARAKESCAALGALNVKTVLVQGIVDSTIIEQANEGKFDLIVIGSHGRTGLSRALLGSVAEKIVRTAPCPVLTVRAKA